MTSYETLGVVEFGRHLVGSLDLDPAYVAFCAKDVLPGPEAQARWLLSYWCLYDVGTACYMSGLSCRDFWECLYEAARNEGLSPLGGRWPRGRERRHWRGEKCRVAAQGLYELAGGAEPLRLVEELRAPTAAEVMKKAQAWPMFGPWIAFKVADMLETCLGWDVDFTDAEVFMFDAPRDAALMVWREQLRLVKMARPRDEAQVLKGVVSWLRKEFTGVYAPPRFKRVVGLQEVETILCKWKSHVNGHYPLGHDTDEFRAALEPWAAVCPTAARFRAALPLEID